MKPQSSKVKRYFLIDLFGNEYETDWFVFNCHKWLPRLLLLGVGIASVGLLVDMFKL